MAEKYYGVNAYGYCAGNPVMMVDPDGNDTWEIDALGRIVSRRRDKSADTFNLIEDQGQTLNSISFDYGTVTFSKKQNKFFGRNVTSFSLSSEKDGAKLFKFFADNLGVEFGAIMMGEKGSVIVSSHEKSSVPVSIEAKKMNRDWDTSISMIIHNHPGNSGPSGFHENSKDGDKYSAKFLPKAQHFVYLPGSGELILYDQKTIYEAKKWEEVFSTLK